jgi:hypothetical protein
MPWRRLDPWEYSFWVDVNFSIMNIELVFSSLTKEAKAKTKALLD